MRYESASRRLRARTAGGPALLVTAAALVLASVAGLPALTAAPADEAPGARAPADTNADAAKKTNADEAKTDAADRAGASPAEAAEKVGDTRKALEKWVETRRLIAEEKRDWALGREMLQQRIELVQREIESLREKIRKAEESIGEAEKKRAELVQNNEKLKAASAQLNEVVIAMENRTRNLLQRLPESIRSNVKPLSQQFPENPEESKLSLGIRFQNVVGVLNHLNKRNRDITVTSEVRDFEDGTSAEVTTLYVGISQAYYVNADATLAGVGTAGDSGWVWTPVNEAAPHIAQAVAILKNEEVASFVRLPVEVR